MLKLSLKYISRYYGTLSPKNIKEILILVPILRFFPMLKLITLIYSY